MDNWTHCQIKRIELERLQPQCRALRRVDPVRVGLSHLSAQQGRWTEARRNPCPSSLPCEATA